MKTLEFLKHHSLAELISKYKIKAKAHTQYPSVYCLVYDQLNTPKTPLTNECRSLIVDLETNKVVSNPFFRFFDGDDKTKIDFETADFVEKLDGSLIHTYEYFDNLYAASKSSSDANGQVKDLDINLSEYFFQYCDVTLEQNKGKTLIWEFRYPQAGIVTTETPSVHLIGERDLETNRETAIVTNPKKFKNHSELNEYLNSLDPTKSEGLICITHKHDEFGNIIRYKFKSPQFELIANLRPYVSDDVKKQTENNRLNTKWLKTIRTVNDHKTFLTLEKYKVFAEQYEAIDAKYNQALQELEDFKLKLVGIDKVYDGIKLTDNKTLQQFAVQMIKGIVKTPQQFIANNGF